MHSPTRRYVTALAISGALLVAGCSGGGDSEAGDTGSDKEVFLQPVAAAGPDPFTESTAKVTETPPPVTRTPQPPPTGSASATQTGIRSIEGSTPGLYGGTQSVSSCDVEQQVRFLTADKSKARAFAQAAGIQENEIAGWLRGLTPVQLRADTRVTNHGYQNGQATSYQSVLQRGTAVLVDNRGLPRVRCACGNPLTPPAELHKDAAHQGQPWQGFRPTNVVVVKPSTTVINNITIINITNNTWIERPIGDDGDTDRIVPPPTPTPDPTLPDGETTDPGEETTVPGEETTVPGEETTEPGDQTTEPGEETTDPADQTTDPGDETTEPGDETTDPEEQTTDPGEETTDPGDETTDPGDETTDPGGETTDPGDETTVPSDETTDCPTVSPTLSIPGEPTPTIPAGCPVPLPVPVPDTGTDRTIPDSGDMTGPEAVPDVPDVEPGPYSPYIPD